MAATWARLVSTQARRGVIRQKGAWLCPSQSDGICARASLMHACGSIGVETLRVMGLSPKAACRHEQTNGVR